MRNLKFRVLYLALIISISLLNSGCATIQRANKVKELEREVAQLTQSIREKDEQIFRLQELLNEQQRQFQEKDQSHKRTLENLRKELNEYRTKLKLLEKKQPNLK